MPMPERDGLIVRSLRLIHELETRRHLSLAEVADTLGLDQDAVVLVDGQALTWHGARTLAGFEHAGAICTR